MNDPAPPAPPRSRLRRFAAPVIAFLLTWAVLAYLVVPELWKRYYHRHPGLDGVPTLTATGSGIPGDPLNVALVGARQQVMKIMVAAKWYPADPLTLKSCLEIAEASVLNRPYEAAPVSNLFLFGRKEDLAFEQAVGNNPRHRHHVRFWETDRKDADGRPIWVGSAVYDEHVGLSRTTGQITHVTAPDVDAERDFLFQCLKSTGALLEARTIEGFQQRREGRNGGGDPWRTDGNLLLGVIKP